MASAVAASGLHGYILRSSGGACSNRAYKLRDATGAVICLRLSVAEYATIWMRRRRRSA